MTFSQTAFPEIDDNPEMIVGPTDIAKTIKPDDIQKIKDTINRAIATKNFPWCLDDSVKLALRDAILLGEIEIVRSYLQNGGVTNINISDSKACERPSIFKGQEGTLISFAVKSGNLSMVKLLVDNRANISPEDDYYGTGDNSAIKAAVKFGYEDIIVYLLEQGADATDGFGNVSSFHNRKQFLTIVAERNQIHLVELFIKFGASVKDAIKTAHDTFFHEYDRCREEKIKEKIKATYQNTLKILLDYAIGEDFSESEYYSLISYLKNIDISQFNFLGISVNGIPVTHALLKKHELIGSKNAIVTRSDLLLVSDYKRRQHLLNQLDHIIMQRGCIIRDEVINVVHLWCAAKLGDIKRVESALKAGVDLNEDTHEPHFIHNNKRPRYPVIGAAQNGHLFIVKMLVLHPKFNKKILGRAIETARLYKQKSVEIFLESVEESKEFINQADEEGRTPLCRAVEELNINRVKLLIAKGAEINLANQENGYTALHYACSIKAKSRRDIERRSAIIQFLLESKANPNLGTKYNNTLPLELAGNSRNYAIIKLLLMYTEKRKAESCYTKILFASIRSNESIDILKLLKASGANFASKREGETLLHCFFRNFSIVKDEKHYKSTLKNLKQLKLLRYLLENGVNPNEINEQGNTALHEFIRINSADKSDNSSVPEYTSVIDLCLRYGFKINAQDGRGWTLLHHAANQDDMFTVNLLLARGANVNVLNENSCILFPEKYMVPVREIILPSEPAIEEKFIAKPQVENKKAEHPRVTIGLFQAASSNIENKPSSSLTLDQTRRIKELIRSLQTEVNTCFWYLNKSRKQIKIQALNYLLQESEKGRNVSAIIDEIDRNTPDCRLGIISNRVSTLLTELKR